VECNSVVRKCGSFGDVVGYYLKKKDYDAVAVVLKTLKALMKQGGEGKEEGKEEEEEKGEEDGEEEGEEEGERGDGWGNERGNEREHEKKKEGTEERTEEGAEEGATTGHVGVLSEAGYLSLLSLHLSDMSPPTRYANLLPGGAAYPWSSSETAAGDEYRTRVAWYVKSLLYMLVLLVVYLPVPTTL
jgi:hypothetical protein